MSRNFDDLARRAKAGWSDEAVRVHDAATREFAAEVRDRAELGAALAAARRSRSLSQPALSALTGIQQAEISRIEGGSANPTAATILRLVDALGQRLALVPARD